MRFMHTTHITTVPELTSQKLPTMIHTVLAKTYIVHTIHTVQTYMYNTFIHTACTFTCVQDVLPSPVTLQSA